MNLGTLYLGMGALTMLLLALADVRCRRDDPRWWWLIVWPVGLMWPLMICAAVCDLLDGPHRPKHRAETY